MKKEIILELNSIKKSFGNTSVLNGISLSVHKGEFITLLGSSGCGKTTTLRIISGLETPDSGTVLLEGNDVLSVPPNKRNVNTVFQSYALFPHMTVAGNIGYPLKIKKTDKSEIKKRVSEMLTLVQLEGYELRMPSELSGGQKQRVAIARALISQPKILLLDEPLGALDLQLRRQMQLELKRLQKKLGLTFIYITHDQEEALNMSDRIAVMKDGLFEQIGTPAEIYDAPKTSFVASFVGSSNLITGTVKSIDGNTVTMENGSGIGKFSAHSHAFKIGDKVTVSVHAEQVEISLDSGNTASSDTFVGTIEEKSFAGGMLRISVALLNGEKIIANRYGIDSALKSGDKVKISWQAEHCTAVDLAKPEADHE